MKKLFMWFIIISSVLCGCIQTAPDNEPVNLFPPDHFPTVMVCDELYTWSTDLDHPIQNTLPADADYYCEVRHAEGTTPGENGEMTSVFDAAGTIYTVPSDPSIVYVQLTTSWMENKVVTFDQETEKNYAMLQG